MGSDILRQHLDAFSEAAQTGDPRQVAAAGLRTLAWLQYSPQERQALPALEPGLFIGVGRSLMAGGLDDHALALWKEGILRAQAEGDHLLRLHCIALSAQSCLAIADLASAAGLLEEGFRLSSELASGNGQCVLLTGDATSGLRAARIDLMFAQARYQASQGQFRAALDTCTQIEGLIADGPDKSELLHNLNLFRAELYLDCGEFQKVDELYATYQEIDDRHIRERWGLIRGLRLAEVGRLSQAEFEFARLTRENSTVWQTAIESRASLLLRLNRLGAARACIERLGIDHPRRRALEQLVEARRRAPIGELLAINPDLTRAPHEPDSVPFPMIRRTSPRVVVDWTDLSHNFFLLLHTSRVEQARIIFDILEAWTRTMDSPLLALRLELMRAWLVYCAGQVVAAEKMARDLAQQATRWKQAGRFGLLIDAWNARTLCVWALRRDGASPALSAAEQDVQANLRQIESELLPEDKILWKVNKWSAFDAEISRICHRLDSPAKGVWRRWRNSRRTRRALGTILLRRRWDDLSHAQHEAANNPDQQETADAEAQAADAFSWTLRQLKQRNRSSPLPAHFPHAWLLPHDTVVLYYLALPDRLELFRITRQLGYERIALATPRAELRDLVQVAHKAAGQQYCWEDRIAQKLETLSARIGFRSLAQDLPHIRRIVVVPDDALVNTPFSILPVGSGRGRPAVERFVVEVLPVFQWFAPRAKSLTPGLQGALVWATHATGEVQLDFARQEVSAIAQLLGPGAQSIDGEALCATVGGREKLLALLHDKEAAHFACHGKIEPLDIHNSGLLLGSDRLTCGEIQNHRLNVGCVVLSACHLAQSVVLPGREMIGLPAALLSASCDQVISSLWHVPDRTSVDMMRWLYRRLLRVPPGVALARMQRVCSRKLKRREDARHDASGRPALPELRQWACFVAYARGIEPSLPPFRWWLRLKRRFRPRGLAKEM